MKNFKEWQQQTNEMSRQEIMAGGTKGSAQWKTAHPEDENNQLDNLEMRIVRLERTVRSLLDFLGYS
jgi:hypothetical protein